MQKDGDRIVETSVEARQGFLNRPVLVVLVVSCLLAVAALAPSYAECWAQRERNQTDRSA